MASSVKRIPLEKLDSNYETWHNVRIVFILCKWKLNKFSDFWIFSMYGDFWITLYSILFYSKLISKILYEFFSVWCSFRVLICTRQDKRCWEMLKVMSLLLFFDICHANVFNDFLLQVWVDYNDMKGKLRDAMASAVENSWVVLVCASLKYKDSTNCRMGECVKIYFFQDLNMLFLRLLGLLNSFNFNLIEGQ